DLLKGRRRPTWGSKGEDTNVAESERTTREYRQIAWGVYLTHQDVIRAVLRLTGPWRVLDGADVAHDFLVERLPAALTTYDPEVGPLRPWLFAVFHHYARRRAGQLTAVRRGEVTLGWLSEDMPAAPAAPKPLGAGQLRAVVSALENLPPNQRALLEFYFGGGAAAGNLRALS